MTLQKRVVRALSMVTVIATLALSQPAHADTGRVPIGDPFSDTFQFWSVVLTSIESMAHELAAAFIPTTAQHTAANKPDVQQTLNAPTVAATAYTAAVSASLPQSATPSGAGSTATTSDQTTQSQFVKSAQSSSSAISPAFQAATALLPVQQPIANPFTDAVQFWNAIVASIESLSHELATAFIPNQSQLTESNSPHVSKNLNSPPVAPNAFEAAVGAALPPSTKSSQSASTATSDQTTQSTFVKSPDLSTVSSTAAWQPPSTDSVIIKSTPFTSSASDNSAPSPSEQNQFDALSNRLSNLTAIVGNLAALLPSLSQPQYNAATALQIAGDGNPQAIGAGAAIDNLSNVTITNPSITGLSASDIPDLSGSYLSLGGGTLTGAFTDASAGSSSFAGSLGIGTTSPSDTLAVNGPIYLANITPAATTNRLYSNAGSLYWAGSVIAGGSVGNWTTDGANVWRTGGNVGIGTTTPGSALSLEGVANFTTATSTYYSTGGINLAAGCFAIAGNCLGFSNLSGTLAVANGGTGQTSFNQGWLSSNGSALSASTSPTVNYITATSTTATSTFSGSVSSPHFSAPAATTNFSNAATNAWLYGDSAITGDTTESNTFFAGYQINDSVVDTASQPLIDAFKVEDQLTQPTLKGARTAIQGILRISTSTANAGSNAFYVSVEGDSTAVSSDGGTNVNPMGSMDGSEFSSSLFNAQNYVNVFGEELGVTVDASSSTQFKTGLSIDEGSNDATRGYDYDTALKISGGGGTAPGWANGITFGDPAHAWPFASDSNLVVATPNSLNHQGTPLLANVGIDFSKVLFTTDALKLPGFIVGPTGNTLIANALISTNSAGVSLDIPDEIVTAVSVASGGTSCTLGDLLYFGSQGIAKITSVSGGSVNGVTLNVPDVSASPPSNPVTTTSDTCLTPPTLNLTWSLQNALALNPSGGKVGVATATPAYALDVNGDTNIAGGNFYRIGGQGIVYASSTLSDLDIGFSAGAATTTTGTFNVAIGLSALSKIATGAQNVAVGSGAGQSVITGSANTLLGFNAANANTGFQNVVIGSQALSTSGAGNSNTVVGFEAGKIVTSGSDNTFVGWEAASTTQTGSNNIVLGYNIDLPSANGSNQIDLGNLLYGTGLNGALTTVSTGNIGVGTSTPYSRLEVWGPDNTASTTAFSVVNSASSTELAVLDNGNATLAGNLIQNSDQRLKTNIQSLDASSSLAAINNLNPVTFNWIDPNKGSTQQLGFIAQHVLPIFPNLISTTSPTPLTPDGTLSLNYIGLISPIVSAIQALSSELTSLENTIAGFAQSFTSAIGNFGTVNTQQLCVSNSPTDQSPVCVSKTQLAALLSQSAAAGLANPSPATNGSNLANSTPDSNASSTTPDTPPVIQINGDNPATIQVGATYTDLGATITGPQQDLNLGIQAIVDDGATTTISNIEIDTSVPGTHTIEYVATDQNGLEGTAIRTVTVVPAPNSDVASSTDATPTTAASSSAQ